MRRLKLARVVNTGQKKKPTDPHLVQSSIILTVL
jgi:hypothetical protein